MPLSWNEIKTRAADFVLEWKDSQTVRKKAEAQTFETDLFIWLAVSVLIYLFFGVIGNMLMNNKRITESDIESYREKIVEKKSLMNT